MSTEAPERCTGWQFPELREVSEIVTGSTPPKARKELYGGSFPFVKPGELLHCAVYESEDCLSEEGAKVADVAPAGSILVSCIGNLGKTGLALSPVAFNQQINAVIPRNPDESKWIFYAVQSPKFAEELAAVSSATTIAIVNKRKFSSLRIPVAPGPEQQRIVAEIEKQFTRLDAGVAALRRVQANLKRYRAAVLKAACEGQLVPTEADLHPSSGKGQNRFESGEQLLKRILAERRERSTGRGKYKKTSLPDTCNLPSLPAGWTWATADQLSAFDDGAICAGPFGTIFKARDFRPTGVPIIFLRHVAPGHYLTHKPGFMDEAKWDQLFRPYSVFGGELLVTKLGEPPGVCAIYPHGIGPAMVTPDVIKMTPNPEVAHPVFLMHYFNSQTARDFATGVAFGTTRLRLTLPIFRDMPVPLPPLAEQSRIVAEVERHLSVIEELESVVLINLQRSTHLRQSILQKAFTGKLTA